ncbi:MAG: YkvA family protein [Tumebacillaceae bacterium]
MADKPGFVKNVVAMFKDRGTPLRDKALMIGGVAYFVSPIDLIPDFIALLGYTDDLGVLIGTGMLFSKSYKRYVNRFRG